jgi:hypothetical protein
MGPQGVSITLVGSVPTPEDLPETGNEVNDAYIVDSDGDLWVWATTGWYSVGQIVGPQGLQGDQGPQGETGATGPAGLVYKNEWQVYTTYFINDVVTHNGSSWIAVVNISGASYSEPGPGNSDWEILAAKGSNGTGFQWKGDWSSSMPYGVGDVVVYAGQNYVSTTSHGMTSDSPDIDTMNWDEYFNGPAGETGPAGPGVAAGGTANQFLIKVDGTDYNTAWSNTIDGGSA